MKKLIISILIPSLLLSLCSCYSMQEVSKNEFISHESDKQTWLKTKDGTVYQIDKSYFSFLNDTITVLEGKKQVNKEITTPFIGNIAVADITNFNELQTLDKGTLLVARDNSRYQVKKLTYTSRKDTIIIIDGTKLIPKGTETPFVGKLAVEETDIFFVYAKDETRTITLYVASLIVAIALVYLVAQGIKEFKASFPLHYM